MSGYLVSRTDLGEFRRRYKWMALAAFVGFAAVALRLFFLQIVKGAEYAALAHENIIRRVTLPTTRGIVRDTRGKILIGNRPSYQVEVVPGAVLASARPLHFRNGRPVRRDPDTWPKIADVLRLNPDERGRFEARMREACKTDEDRSPCWRSILVREDIPRDVVAEFKQHKEELSGAEVTSTSVRLYPHGHLAAHLLGYIAEIDPDTLATFRPEGYEDLPPEERQKKNPLGYEAGDMLGATGLERAWESYLRGGRGWEKRVVDARGHYRVGPDAERLIDEPKRQEPMPGRDLKLSVDVELVEAISKAMAPHWSGAVVVVEARTGRILALYSKPNFDPNDLSGGLGKTRVRETFNKLYPDPLRPMLDKTTSGVFQPGSTFKPFAALAALSEQSVRPEDNQRCDGYIAYGREIKRCTHVHGIVNMRAAIAESCNIYFFRLAEAVGLDPMARVAHDFGLGDKTGIGVNPEAAGRVPNRAWYASRYHAQFFRKGFTLHAAIGEGDVVVTPLQLALAYAAIGNGGTLYEPQLVRALETTDGVIAEEFPPRVRRKVKVRSEYLERVVSGLSDVVNDPRGTAYPVRDTSLDVAGKTGTAQTGYVAPSGEDPKIAWYRSRDHAWFAAFAPASAPEISVVVLIEHGESGPKYAAPVAMQVVREYKRLRAEREKKSMAPGVP